MLISEIIPYERNARHNEKGSRPKGLLFITDWM